MVIRAWVLALVLLRLCIPPLSQAFGTLPTDEFGLGMRDAAMGMAHTAAVDDFTSVYYNPAGLTNVDPGIAFDFGYKAVGRLLAVPEEDAQGFVSLPVIGVSYRPERPAEPGWLRLPALGLGVVGTLPDLRRQKDDNDPHSIRYNSQAMIPIYAGAGYEVTPRFSIGVTLAFTFAGSFEATAVSSGTLVDPEFSGLGLSGPIQLSVVPHAGVLLRPSDDWRLGLAYRHSQSLSATTKFRVEQEGLAPPLPVGTVSDSSLDFVAGWSPKQLAAGVAYDGLPGWLFSGDLVFKKWDEWESSTGRHPDPEFRNRVVPRIGIELQLTRFLAAQGGYYFEATPVPDQSGDTSYVDNDQHVFSAGLSYSLDRFLRVRTVISPMFQAHWLASRTTRKADPDNDFFPGYEVSGAVLSGGLVIRVYP